MAPENIKIKRYLFKRKLYVIAVWLLLVGGLIAYYLTGIRLTAIFPGCLFLKFTGLYCPGCGGTRAMQFLLKGEIIKSLRYNFITMAGASLLLISLVQYSLNVFFNKKYKLLITYDYLLWGAVIAIFAFWAIRNII